MPAGAILDVQQAFEDPQVRTLPVERPVVSKALGPIRLVGHGVNLERTPPAMRPPRPSAASTPTRSSASSVTGTTRSRPSAAPAPSECSRIGSISAWCRMLAVSCRRADSNVDLRTMS